MTARDYRVTFGYGATSAPYSPSRPHRGNDRACPSGTPIVIGATTIGLTGNTGLSTGAHLHTQAGTDSATQNTIDPTGNEFKEGTVTALRTTDDRAWGKYVTIKNINGIYVTYAHLSQVNVKVGQVIKEEDTQMIDKLLEKIANRDALIKKLEQEKKNRDVIIADLKAKLAVQSKDTENLNKLGETLVWLLARLGVK